MAQASLPVCFVSFSSFNYDHLMTRHEMMITPPNAPFKMSLLIHGSHSNNTNVKEERES